MTSKPKTLQEIFRERRMKDMKRDYYFYRAKQFWTLIKRLTLVASLGYGVHWGYKNPQKLQSFLKSHSAPIEEKIGSFKEGIGMIRETLDEAKNTERSKAYHDLQEKRLKEYREVGIDPVIKYAESGTKDYQDELEFYRKSGVFDAGKE